MTSDHELLKEIESGELWLCGLCHEPPPPSVERIKLRVRISAQQLWLKEQMDDAAPLHLADRVKQVVRTVVQQDRAVAVTDTRKTVRLARLTWWAVGVAGAAAVVLFAFIGLHGQRDILEEPLFVEAFVSMRDGDFEAALAALDSDVMDMEMKLDDLRLAQADDWLLLTIGDDLDNIVIEPTDNDDWL